MTWHNPKLAQAAQQWRMAQGALVRSQRPISFRDEESSSPHAHAVCANEVDKTALQLRASHALSECLRISRQADNP